MRDALSACATVYIRYILLEGTYYGRKTSTKKLLMLIHTVRRTQLNLYVRKHEKINLAAAMNAFQQNTILPCTIILTITS